MGAKLLYRSWPAVSCTVRHASHEAEVEEKEERVGKRKKNEEECARTQISNLTVVSSTTTVCVKKAAGKRK